ncbi:MAG TPA: XdhC family protein [Acidimicrobiales bacterium]|nr:XdhC family protein [Acidimicrobiales bacterium]
MIRQDLSGRSAALRAARVPFVHARVVLAERPTSAKPGDEAIVLADGAMEGFVGGECARTTVCQQSLEALPAGESVLLRITPHPEPDQPGKKVVHNPCLSGGTLEVFLEPSLPAPLVHVVGDSPTAMALFALGSPLGYALRPYEGRIEADAAAVVVASHGRGEEEPLTAALQAGVPYVGLVASRRRGAAVVAGLAVSDDLKARVRTPAGLDIGAGTAEEVALSVLAEIVAGQPRTARAGRPVVAAVCPEVDPVCGMSVVAGADTLHVVHPDPAEGGRLVWFCGPGCRKAFLADPGAYPGPVPA